MKAPYLAALALALAASPCFAQSLSLKQFVLGAPAAQCPADTVKRWVEGSELYCLMGPTTLANQPARSVVLTIFQGKVSAVMFDFPTGDGSAYSEILSALKEKFGPPTLDKPHINAAHWVRGRQSLRFDGYSGSVLLMDHTANDLARKLEAAKNKSDL